MKPMAWPWVQRQWAGWILRVTILASTGFGLGCRRQIAAKTVAASEGPIEQWAVFTGTIEARRVHTILAPVAGQGTLIELASEGDWVKAGEVVARFDTSRLERDLVRLEAALISAESEYHRLKEAEGPLKLLELQRRLDDARAEALEATQRVADYKELFAEGLVTAREVEQQEARAARAGTLVRDAELQLQWTRDYLLPQSLEQARSRMEAARREFEIAKAERDACTVRAPADGRISHLPLNLGGEWRPARVGDTLFKNQPFMVIPEEGELWVRMAVPEAELARVPVGAKARIMVPAFPNLTWEGVVERVSATAQTLAGKPASQRFFMVGVTLLQPDARLRPGLSAVVEVLVARRESALRIPRPALHWEGGMPQVRVRTPEGRFEIRRIVLGVANDRHVEVREGLRAGELVVVE